ncbi:MAG: hypothetical protein WC635_11210 [Bacteriovorax sp.]|jgi:hypothetical protein
MRLILLLIFSSLFACHAFGAYYDTLPQGVRNLTFRIIQTSNITGSYGSSGNLKGYNVNANINADSIRGVNAAVDLYLDSLSAADYANFSFGTFQGSASSKVTAQVIGGGYGLTDQLTMYGFIPFYSAVVDLQIARTSKGRNNVGGAIQLENLPDVDVRLIQSLFVNYYKYQPLGKWQATDFGDAELGMMYQVSKYKNSGTLINFGAIVPSGRTDNPDILQDIAFGDGQWDAFFEFGGGVTLSEDWSIDNSYRFTYQFPYTDTVRLPESNVFPVTATKGSADIKLGNKYQTNLQGNYRLSEQWSSSLIYSLEYVEPSNYKSSSANADRILEENSEKISHVGRVNLGYSTVNLYKKKKFFMPMNFNLAVQSVFAGKNVPKYERADFEMSFFF